MPEDAFERAVGALGQRERTTAELEAWLAERGHPAAEIDAAVERLIAIGELDDERFARRYAEDKRLLAGWGPDRIARTLERRGVPRKHIMAVLEGDDESAQLERATSLLLGRGMSCDTKHERERALGLLVRRGYSLELAYDAVRAAERRLREAA